MIRKAIGTSEEIQVELSKRGLVPCRVGVSRKNEADIYYKVYGTGKMRIVFLMGFLGRADIWEPQVEYFAKEHSVLVLDNRGVGLSSLTKGRYTTKMMAMDAYEVMESLHWDSYHIVGSSMGGMIAQELALIAPEKVDSMALLSTHAGGIRGFPPFYGLFTILRNMFTKDISQNHHNSMVLLYGEKRLRDKVFYKKTHAEGVQRLYRYGLAPFQAFLCQMAATFTHYVSASRFDILKQHKIPSLVLTGTPDYMVRCSNTRIIAKLLGVQPTYWEGYGHHLPGECPEKLNALLQKHFTKKRQ